MSGKSGREEGGRTGPERRSRWPRRIGIALLSILGSVLLVVVGGYVYLTSRAGSERLRRLVVEQTNASIRGSLALEGLQLRGTRLLLRGVTLRDPEGGVVGEVERVEVAVAPFQLLRRQLDLSQVLIEQPRLYLEQDERGLNLARAVASRKPKPERPPKPKPRGRRGGLSIVVEELSLRGGLIDFRQDTGGTRRVVRLEGLDGEGGLRLEPGGTALRAELGLTSRLTEPLKGPVELELKARGQGERRTVDVALTVAGARLVATARVEGPERAHVRVDTLRVDPETARAFVPTYPLVAAASMEGDVDRDGDRVDVRLRARAGSATATVEGALDLATKRTPGLRLALRGVDLSELVAGGPTSDVQLDLAAEGGGTSLDTLDARVSLTAPTSTMGGLPFGPVRLRAGAQAGRFELIELFARVPGLLLRASGRGTREHLALEGRVEATDLAALGRTLGKLAGPTGLPLAGAGTLEISATGHPSHPGVSLRGTFPRLRFAQNELRGLSLSATLPDVKQPLDARLSLDARRVALAGRRFTGVHVGVEGEDRRIRVETSARGATEFALTLTGTIDEDRRGLGLDALQLRYPEATWRLERPARVAFGGGRLAAERLTLRSGRQRIALDGWKRGARLRATVAIEALDLGRLPRAFVGPSLALGGQLTARVRADGTTERPQVRARVELRRGRLQRYTDLSLSLEGAYVGERATGRLAAHGVGVSLDADFDVPVRALRTRRPEPLHVTARIEELELAKLLGALGIRQPLSGFARADLRVTGTAAEPVLELAANGRSVRYEQLPPSELSFVLASGEGGGLGARLEMQTLDRKSRVELRTPFTIAGLLQEPPTKEVLLRTPIELDADIRKLALPIPYVAGLTRRELLGNLSVRGQVRGPVLAPMGELRAAIDGLVIGDMREPIDLVLDLSSASEGIRAELSASREGQPILGAKARVDAAVATLGELRHLVQAPLSLRAEVGPMPVADLQALTRQEDVPGPKPRRLDGTLRATLSAEGTLSAPRLKVRSRVERLGTPDTRLGTVVLDYDYADARHLLGVLMCSANGGQMRLTADARLDLSYPAVARGPGLDEVPFSAELSSRDLDLSFLSGVTPRLRTIAGRLQASARVGGTVGSPEVRGEVEWTGGRLALLGYGDYRDVHLQLTGDAQRIELRELSARAGEGRARMTATARRTGPGYALDARADLDRFPIVTQGQLLATLSLRGEAQGEQSPERLDIRRLGIAEAQIELPDVRRKDLQPLDEPRDLVLVRDGVPIEPVQPRGTGGAGGQPSRRRVITVRIDAPRNLWVRGNDVNAELGLSDDFRFELSDAPYLFGRVRVMRGRVDVLGRRFDLQPDSLVRFSGPPSRPELDVTALHVNEREDVKVALHVTGRVGDIRLEPTSTPPLTESEIYTLLATGRRTLRPNGGSASPGGQAASLLGSLAASQLKEFLSANLPLDVLSIEAGDQGLAGTKLEAGTYVSDDLYLGFTGQFGVDPTVTTRRENANAVRLEYQISRRWSLEAEYGDARSGSADLIWRKEY